MYSVPCPSPPLSLLLPFPPLPLFTLPLSSFLPLSHLPDAMSAFTQLLQRDPNSSEARIYRARVEWKMVNNTINMKILHHTYTHTNVSEHIRTYIHTYIHTHIPMSLNTYVRTFIRTYIHTCTGTCSPLSLRSCIDLQFFHLVHMYVRMYVRIYICTYVCMYVRMYMHKTPPSSAGGLPWCPEGPLSSHSLITRQQPSLLPQRLPASKVRAYRLQAEIVAPFICTYGM